MSDFLQEMAKSSAARAAQAPTFTDADFDADDSAIVDFRYSTHPRLGWFFDHHVSAFQLPGQREHFEGKLEAQFVRSLPAQRLVGVSGLGYEHGLRAAGFGRCDDALRHRLLGCHVTRYEAQVRGFECIGAKRPVGTRHVENLGAGRQRTRK